MSTIEFKEQIIRKLKETEDDDLLEGVYRLLELDNEFNDVYILSAKERERLAESKGQIERGEYITDEELNIKMDQWLNE